MPATHRVITLHHCTHPLQSANIPREYHTACIERRWDHDWLTMCGSGCCCYVNTFATRQLPVAPYAHRMSQWLQLSHLATLTVEANHHICLVAPTLQPGLLIPLAAKLFSFEHWSRCQLCVFSVLFWHVTISILVWIDQFVDPFRFAQLDSIIQSSPSFYHG